MPEQCTVEDAKGNRCEREVRADGLCAPHYKRKLRNGTPGQVHIGKARTSGCREKGCKGAHWRQGRCRVHYLENLLRSGGADPKDLPRLLAELEEARAERDRA